MEKETNLEHYLHRLKRIIKEACDCPKLIFKDIQKYIDPEIKHTNVEYTNDILEWLAQEYKPELLDKVEKKYLSEVIRPFRKEVTGVVKQTDSLHYRAFLRIQLGDDYLTFPYFKRDTMYKGMEYDKTYKPEELGL